MRVLFRLKAFRSATWLHDSDGINLLSILVKGARNEKCVQKGRSGWTAINEMPSVAFVRTSNAHFAYVRMLNSNGEATNAQISECLSSTSGDAQQNVKIVSFIQTLIVFYVIFQLTCRCIQWFPFLFDIFDKSECEILLLLLPEYVFDRTVQFCDNQTFCDESVIWMKQIQWERRCSPFLHKHNKSHRLLAII